MGTRSGVFPPNRFFVKSDNMGTFPVPRIALIVLDDPTAKIEYSVVARSQDFASGASGTSKNMVYATRYGIGIVPAIDSTRDENNNRHYDDANQPKLARTPDQWVFKAVNSSGCASPVTVNFTMYDCVDLEDAMLLAQQFGMSQDVNIAKWGGTTQTGGDLFRGETSLQASGVTGSISDQVLVPARSTRRSLRLRNQEDPATSSNTVYLAYTGSAAVLNKGDFLRPGDAISWGPTDSMPGRSTDIHFIATAGNPVVSVQEGT